MAYSKTQIEQSFSKIIKKISDEGFSLRTALSQEDMPSSQTFYKWIDDDEIKSKQYARACEERAEYMAQEILDIADENNADAYIDDEGNAKIDGNVVQRSKLRVDTRKWLMSKQAPKKYGDKTDTTVKQDITISFK